MTLEKLPEYATYQGLLGRLTCSGTHFNFLFFIPGKVGLFEKYLPTLANNFERKKPNQVTYPGSASPPRRRGWACPDVAGEVGGVFPHHGNHADHNNQKPVPMMAYPIVYISMPLATTTMNVQTILLLFIILVGCSQDNRPDNFGETADVDSLAHATLGQEEQASWDFFQQIEAALRDKEGIPEDQIGESVQALIDKGAIPQPEIFIETETGTASKLVDYKTYKKFRQENPINSERQYTVIISFESDDAALQDSIRNGLIEVLEGDGLD